MISWISAAIIGLMIAALHYGRSPRFAPAALRAIAGTLIAAMLLAAPSAPSRPAPPRVALDVSSSWTRGDPAGGLWARAAATARSLAAGDSIVLFGDSLRGASAPPAAPADRHSAIAPVLDAARETHRPLMIVSDGEFTDGATLPAGTHLTTIARPSLIDAARITVAEGQDLRAGENPYASQRDAEAVAGTHDARFAGYKYLPMTLAAYLPLGALGARGIVLTNLLL